MLLSESASFSSMRMREVATVVATRTEKSILEVCLRLCELSPLYSPWRCEIDATGCTAASIATFASDLCVSAPGESHVAELLVGPPLAGAACFDVCSSPEQGGAVYSLRRGTHSALGESRVVVEACVRHGFECISAHLGEVLVVRDSVMPSFFSVTQKKCKY